MKKINTRLPPAASTYDVNYGEKYSTVTATSDENTLGLCIKLFIGVALTFAAYLVGMSVWSLSWPSAPGTVISSQIVTGTNSSRSSALVEYQYTVHGINYKSSRISFDSRIGMRGSGDTSAAAMVTK